ncbi:MAG: hypothetical protein ABSA76_01290 [Bacteroidales bacterium]
MKTTEQKIIEKQEELIRAFKIKFDIDLGNDPDQYLIKLESELSSLEKQGEPIESLESSKAENENNLKPIHKCKLIAKACMGEGREWWCGELTEPVKEYPLETHCLHLKTQLKDIVFLCNRADFQQLQLLGRSVTGKLNESWMDSMMKVVSPFLSPNKAEKKSMEEEILKIITINIPDCIIDKNNSRRAKDAVKEITSHIIKFIFWLSWDYESEGCILKDDGSLTWVDEENNEITLNEIYLQWLNNVKK